MKKTFKNLTSESEKLRIGLEKAEEILKGAQELLGKLTGEKTRWEEQVKELDEQLQEVCTHETPPHSIPYVSQALRFALRSPSALPNPLQQPEAKFPAPSLTPGSSSCEPKYCRIFCFERDSRIQTLTDGGAAACSWTNFSSSGLLLQCTNGGIASRHNRGVRRQTTSGA